MSSTMAKLSLQFHATADELVAWAADWALEHELQMAVERFFPETRCVAVEGTDVTSALEKLGGTWNRIWFSKKPLAIDPLVDLPFGGESECMVLSAGSMTGDGLRESAVGAVSVDPSALRTWRRIIKSAKKHLRKGASVFNPVSGARQRQENHYFTEGALEASLDGVKMLAAAGWNQFELDGSDG